MGLAYVGSHFGSSLRVFSCVRCCGCFICFVLSHLVHTISVPSSVLHCFQMIQYPQAVLNWVLAPISTGGWTIEEWHSHYSSFDQDAWAAYYSARVVVKGRQYEPEE